MERMAASTLKSALVSSSCRRSKISDSSDRVVKLPILEIWLQTEAPTTRKETSKKRVVVSLCWRKECQTVAIANQKLQPSIIAHRVPLSPEVGASRISTAHSKTPDLATHVVRETILTKTLSML